MPDETRVAIEMEAVRWFANRMMEKLEANRDKSPWRGELTIWLLGRLRQELTELEEALEGPYDPDRVIPKCADVANFAMMIADKARTWPRRPT